MKTLLKLLFCPIWVLYEHNFHEKLIDSKNVILHTVFIALFVVILFVLVYYVWGELL